MTAEARSVVVVGAGVIGLAIAREFARRGDSVFVLEREKKHGMGISSRNSGVIHAGIYYAPGSLKAKLTVEGKQLLYDYLARFDLPYNRCGKLIVATAEEEVPQLEALEKRAAENGVNDIVWVERGDIERMEPQVGAIAALLSPSTGVLSVHSLLNALEAELNEAGGDIAVASELVAADRTPAGWTLHVRGADGELDTLAADLVINAAGLYADVVAAFAIDIDSDVGLRLDWTKGSYFSVRGLHCDKLIYPVPPVSFKGLGTHVTVDLAGGARLGPDIEDLEGRVEKYDVDVTRQQSFFESARRFLPGLAFDDLAPDYSGIRPQRAGMTGFRDFYIAEETTRGAPGWINLIGMESPGLTAALAVARYVVALAH